MPPPAGGRSNDSDCLRRLERVDSEIVELKGTVRNSTTTLAKELNQVREETREQFHATNAAQARENIELKFEIQAAKDRIGGVADELDDLKCTAKSLTGSVASLATTMKIHSMIFGVIGSVASIILAAYMKTNFDQMAANEEKLHRIERAVDEGAETGRNIRREQQQLRREGVVTPE